MAPYPGYKPVNEPFVCKIVDVRWPTDDEVHYVLLTYTIYRKILTTGLKIYYDSGLNIEAYGNYIGNAGYPEGYDAIDTTLITSKNFAWPAFIDGNGLHYPIPEEDVMEDPNEMHSNAFVFPGVVGAPSLPGISGLGAGQLATGASFFGAQNNASPGIRTVQPEGIPFIPRWPDDVPEPPQLAQANVVYQVNDWSGATAATLQLFNVEVHVGGETLAEFELNFGGLRVNAGGADHWFRAVALAAVPAEEGFVRHHPPFSTNSADVVSLNTGLHNTDFWLLCERMDASEVAGEGLVPPEPPP